MKKTLFIFCCLIGASALAQTTEGQMALSVDQSATERPLKRIKNPEFAPIEKLLDAWHQAAADSNFDDYFGSFSADAVFIGTDASENWNFKEFQRYVKPYFDKKRGWKFKVIDRNIYPANARDLVWFDELLETDMKICRGSGVLRMEDGQWKIVHYVLSMTVPNENTQEVVKIKTSKENDFLKSLKQQ